MGNFNIKDEDWVDRKPNSMELTFKINEEDTIEMDTGDIITRRNWNSKSWIGALQFQREISEIMQWRDLFYSQAINQLPEEKIR